MTLAEIAALVHVITKRPDLTALTDQSIRLATIKLHRFNKFRRDILSQVLTVTANADFRYTVDLTNYPRIRLPYSLTLNSGSEYGTVEFEELEPHEIFKDYLVEKTNYFYIIGTSMVIKADRSITTLDLLYYAFPITDAVNYSSWIADNYTDIIVNAASAAVFKSIGKDSEARVYNLLTLTDSNDLLKDEK